MDMIPRKTTGFIDYVSINSSESITFYKDTVANAQFPTRIKTRYNNPNIGDVSKDLVLR